MDRFHPKKFAMWRLHLLLLLIFLEAIYDSTGLMRGVDASNPDADYKDWCTSDADCRPEHECDLDKNECICRNFFTSSRIRNLYAVYYDRQNSKCVSLVGKLCSTDDKRHPELYKIPCVPNAECVRQVGKLLPDVFGLCHCKDGYAKTSQHLCEPTPTITIPGNPVFSMAQVSNPDGSVVDPVLPRNSYGNEQPETKTPTKTEDDRNGQVDVYKNVQANYVKTELAGTSNSNTISPTSFFFLTVTITVIKLFAFVYV